MKIIKFYSDTCGPCKVLDSNLKKAGIDYESINANSDENDILVEKYKIQSVPTLIKEENGVEVGRHIGIMTEEQLKHWCND
nr:MAG TPA: TRX family protein [Bacteriophage sp.]